MMGLVFLRGLVAAILLQGSVHAAPPEPVVTWFPQPALSADQLGVIVSDADPDSIAIAAYYRDKRGIPAANVIHVRFTPGRSTLAREEFVNLKRRVDRKTPRQVQAYALTWAQPYRVDCMSITAAFTFGFDPAWCASGCKPTRPSPYFNSSVARPFDTYKIFDPEKLAAFLMDDKRHNPSNYAMVTISEGAQMTGGKIIEYGQADAFGHKKLGGIGAITGEALKKITGEDILYQQISYLMRSGAPDSLDLMAAVNYANMAIKLITGGPSNRMVALRNGTYTSIPIATIMQGIKRVDVEELYDAENYLPKVRHVEGKPMFLY